MEVRSEGTKNISFFWRNLNNALREATEEPDTMFNPCNIMVDENGANFCGVKEVFGLDYCLEKVYKLPNAFQERHPKTSAQGWGELQGSILEGCY